MHEEPPAAAFGSGTILIAADFAARYPGNFLATELLVASAVRQRLGLDCAFALPERAAKRKWPALIEEQGFRYAWIPAGGRRRASSLLEWARSVEARILHAHFVWFDLDCLYVARRLRAGVVWHLHNGLLGYPAAQRAGDLVKARLLGRAVDAVVACSPQVGRDALRRGFPSRRVEVITNGIVLERLGPSPGGRRRARARLGVEEGSFVVLALGWPPERKGVDVYVRALERVRASAPAPVVGILVGEPALQGVVEETLGEVPTWIQILAPVEDLAPLLRASDVFVSASREEGFSYAVGEALACSVTVVLSDIAGTAHYWGAPGVLRYSTEDPGALAARLGEVMASPDTRRRADGNREWRRSHFGIDSHLEARLELYSRLLARHPRRQPGRGGAPP